MKKALLEKDGHFHNLHIYTTYRSANNFLLYNHLMARCTSKYSIDIETLMELIKTEIKNLIAV